jgi:phage terminase small subunit
MRRAVAPTKYEVEPTLLERAFAVEFFKDFNGTQAWIRSGGSAKSAHVLASRKLKSAKVQALMAKQYERLQRKAEKTLDDYVAEDDKIAFRNADDFVESFEGGIAVLRDWSQLSRDQKAAVNSIKVIEKDGAKRTEIRFEDKGASLQRAQQRFGALLNVNKDADTEEDWRHRFNLMGEVVRDVLTARLGQVPAAECMAELLKRYHDRRAGEKD